ncbi:MAG: dihydrofolate reductase family protein [Anaerolineae bacterium]
MTALTPFQTLYDAEDGPAVPLPPGLRDIYGDLRLPRRPGQPFIMGNFVTTLDGVVSLDAPGKSGGAEISGANRHDRMLMGLLRALADVIIVGAGTLRAVPRAIWTAEHIYPPLAEEFRGLRASLAKEAPPLNVFVTARGDLDLTLPVFLSGKAPVLIVTTPAGARAMGSASLPSWVQIAVVDADDAVSARAILACAERTRPSEVILVEAGPRLMGEFFAERCLDELFLTLAPQVAGRDGASDRPGLVMGRVFAPDDPRWGTLMSVKRAASHLFLRYQFDRSAREADWLGVAR